MPERDLQNMFNNDTTLLSTASRTDPKKAVPVSPDNPLAVQSTPSTILAILTPQPLTVGAAATPLTIPAGANAATVQVVSGAVRRSIGGVPSATTPGLGAGDSEDLRGAELAAYRLIRDGSSDAQVYVEYRTVG